MSVEIRKAGPGDVESIISLMAKFAAYEKLSDYLEITPEKLSAAMFGPGAFVDGLIATLDSQPAGYAIFYPNFLTFRGQRGYFLEDLFVTESARSVAIGEKMLREVARMAAARGFERIDFLVLDWNEPALGFYKKLGAVGAEDELHFKFTDEAFRGLCR